MQILASITISDRDLGYLIDGLDKLLTSYEVDSTSTHDVNFKRQMCILQKKLQSKQNKAKHND